MQLARKKRESDSLRAALSFLVSTLVGLAGDRVSLGFVLVQLAAEMLNRNAQRGGRLTQRGISQRIQRVGRSRQTWGKVLWQKGMDGRLKNLWAAPTRRNTTVTFDGAAHLRLAWTRTGFVFRTK